jgi:hypothetical protein
MESAFWVHEIEGIREPTICQIVGQIGESLLRHPGSIVVPFGVHELEEVWKI